MCATRGEILRRRPASISQTADDVAAANRRAAIEELLHQLVLHTGDRGMNARPRQVERSGAAAVGLRLCVDVRAGIEQHPCDLDDVRRRLLPKILDAVRRDVVQQRRVVLAHGSRVHELRIFTQQSREFPRVAGDNGVHGLLEA